MQTSILALHPSHWKEYQLLDSGNFEKLERFGDIIVARPEPQAVWRKSLSEEEWQKKADAIFKRDKNADKSSEKGEWFSKSKTPDKWFVHYQHQELKLRFKVALSSFKHVGVFPEQAVNWDYIYQKVNSIKNTVAKPKVLNLFAYTGIASLAAKKAGAEVTHVDSIKQVLSWANDNMTASQLDNIRWIAEDALKFVKREVRRGSKYHGIILDPPAYGRGANGEKWILEDHIDEMMENCAQLLDEKQHFLVLNLYSMGFSSIIAENLVRCHFPHAKALETGELFIPDQFQKKLPLGIFCRFSSL